MVHSASWMWHLQMTSASNASKRDKSVAQMMHSEIIWSLISLDLKCSSHFSWVFCSKSQKERCSIRKAVCAEVLGHQDHRYPLLDRGPSRLAVAYHNLEHEAATYHGSSTLIVLNAQLSFVTES